MDNAGAWAARRARMDAAGAWAAQQQGAARGASPVQNVAWAPSWPAQLAAQTPADLAPLEATAAAAAAEPGSVAAAVPPQALSVLLPARPPTYVFVSDSHLWLRVMRAAARREGLRVHADPRARVDTGALVQALLSRAQPFHASSPVSVSIYGVGVPRVDSVWMGAWELGVRTRFRPPRTEDEARGVRRVEPDMLVDAAVVVGAASQVCAPGSCPGRMILVTGDASVQPLVEAAVAKGWFVAVAAPRDSPALAHAFACGGTGIVLEDLVAAATVTHLCVPSLGLPVPAALAFEAEGVVPEAGLQYDQLCSGVARALTIATRLPWQARVAPCPRRGGALAVLAVVQVGTTPATLKNALASAAAAEGGVARESRRTRGSGAAAPGRVPEPRGSTTAAAGTAGTPSEPGAEDARRQSWADRVKAALTNRGVASAPSVPPGEATTAEDDDWREAGVQAHGKAPTWSSSVHGSSQVHASDPDTGNARQSSGADDDDHAPGADGALDAADASGAEIDPGALLDAVKRELARQEQRVQRAQDGGEPLPPPEEVALAAVGLRGLRPWAEGVASLPSRSGFVQVVAAGPLGPAPAHVRDRATAALARGAHSPSDAPLLCAVPEPESSALSTARNGGEGSGGGAGEDVAAAVSAMHPDDYPFLVASGGGIGDDAVASIATGMRPPLVGEHDEEEVPRCWNADRCPYALGCRFAHSAGEVRHFLARAAANALGWKPELRTAREARGARASLSERRGRAVQHGARGRGRQPHSHHRGGAANGGAQAAGQWSFSAANVDVSSGPSAQPAARENHAAGESGECRGGRQVAAWPSAAVSGAQTFADDNAEATDATLQQTARTLSMIFEAGGSWASVAGGSAPVPSAYASHCELEEAGGPQTLQRPAQDDAPSWETAHARPLPPRGRGRRGRNAHRFDGSPGRGGGGRGRGWGRGRGRGRGNLVWNRSQQAQQAQQAQQQQQ